MKKEVKPGELLYGSVMDVLQGKPEQETQETARQVWVSMPELDTAELTRKIKEVIDNE